MPKNAKNGQKMQKRTKCKNLELTQAHPHPTPIQKNDKKNHKKHRILQKKVGRSENQPKKHKKCDFSKRARQKILKIGKIHVIYVYIKNQKQTDELPKSQVGCVLGEVCYTLCTPLYTMHSTIYCALNIKIYISPTGKIFF